MATRYAGIVYIHNADDARDFVDSAGNRGMTALMDADSDEQLAYLKQWDYGEDYNWMDEEPWGRYDHRSEHVHGEPGFTYVISQCVEGGTIGLTIVDTLAEPVHDEIPNLDCMNDDDRKKVMASFASKIQEYFAEGDRHTAGTYRNLLTYCQCKRAATKARFAGNIPQASVHEDNCDKIYNNLPEWARW